MARDLRLKAQQLNNVRDELASIEQALRAVTSRTSYQRVVHLKRKHRALRAQLRRLHKGLA